MVTKFNTNQPTSGSGGNSKTLLIVAGALVAGFLLWRYVIKPAQEKKSKKVEEDME